MKLEIHKNKLKEIIGILKNSLSKGGINPIFEHFLFEIKNKTLTVKATDTKIATIFYCDIENEDNFSFTLQGHTLTSLLASLDADHLFFEYNATTNDVELKCGNYSLDASSGNISEFPEIKIPSELKVIKLPENFMTMLRSVSFSIGADPSKKDLNSLCMDINKDNLNNLSLITTDRIRISYSSAIIGEHDSVRFLIPRSSVSEIEKLEPTHLMYGPKKQRIYFKKETPIGTFFFQTVLTNAVYPDIYTYLTEDFKDGKIIKVKCKDFLRVLKRIRLTSDKLNKNGSIDFEDDRMILSALSASNKSKEKIIINTPEGNPNSFSINIDYVMDYLNQETADNINIKIVNNSCLIFDKENYRHVLAVNS